MMKLKMVLIIRVFKRKLENADDDNAAADVVVEGGYDCMRAIHAVITHVAADNDRA